MTSKKNIVILENIRSAYNVGNVIRTADALGRSVWICGYTPSPLTHPKVKKTSLGAEESSEILEFNNTAEAIIFAKEHNIKVLAAELDEKAIPLNNYQKTDQQLAVVFGNEIEGVLPKSLEMADAIIAIPMQGIKESLNIGQSAAIIMRALQ